jgi:hypothetical protein
MEYIDSEQNSDIYIFILVKIFFFFAVEMTSAKQILFVVLLCISFSAIDALKEKWMLRPFRNGEFKYGDAAPSNVQFAFDENQKRMSFFFFINRIKY